YGQWHKSNEDKSLVPSFCFEPPRATSEYGEIAAAKDDNPEHGFIRMIREDPQAKDHQRNPRDDPDQAKVDPDQRVSPITNNALEVRTVVMPVPLSSASTPGS